jgi:hypothetical protein
MLIKILPDQIAARWESLEPIIKVSLPPNIKGSPEVMKELLQALLEGRLICWILAEDVNKPFGVMTTAIVNDAVAKTKNLLVYSLTSIKVIPDDVWKQSLSTIRSFAKKYGCVSIIAYTNSKRVIDVVHNLGGDTSTSVIVLEV